MKVLIAANLQQPFTKLEETEDRLILDGMEYQKTLLGEYSIEEYIPPEPTIPREEVIQQLAEIDLQKIRPTSDIALGNGDVPDSYGKTPKQRLLVLEAKAADLRKLLS